MRVVGGRWSVVGGLVRLGVVLFAFVCLAAVSAGAFPLTPALSHRVRPQLIVVVANRLVLSDISDSSLKTIGKMLRQGSAGLMSANCLGLKNEPGVLLTAGAGVGCNGALISEFYNDSELIYDKERAGDAYALRTGARAPVGSLVFLDSGPAQRENPELKDSGARLGAIGDALHRAGKKTVAIGNADRLPEISDRSVAVLAMDSRGVVDSGMLWLDHLASCIAWWRSPNASQPPLDLFSGNSRSGRGFCVGGFPEERAMSSICSGDYVVIDYGDSVRLDEYKMSMSDEAYAARKKDVLHNLDELLAFLIDSPRLSGTRIMLVSFSPSVNGAWDQLTPVVLYPASRSGLLISPTTRTPGLIAASDFAPTVLGLLDAPPVSPMVGRAAVEIAVSHNLEKLHDLDVRATANHRLLAPMSWFFAIVGIISFTGAAAAVAFRLRIGRAVSAALKAGLVISACAPVAMLLGVFAPAGSSGYVEGTAISLAVLTVVCLALGTALSARVKVRALPVMVCYFITVAAIIIDAFTGCHLCKLAGPSSYYVSGLRFYGIGNEYAGVLISMAALLTIFIAGREQSSRLVNWSAAAFGVLVIFVLGAGNLGAKYGAIAAAVVTASLIAMAVWRGGFRARHVIVAFVLGIVLMAIFCVLDWKTAGAAGSHGGRLTGMFESAGPTYVLGVAFRKVIMNLTLSTSSAALKTYLGFTPFLVIWFLRLWPAVREMIGKESRVIAGLKAIIVGAACAFVVNDSGLVFASLMIGMTVLVLLYSLLEEHRVAPELLERPRVSARKEAAECPES